MNPNRQLERVEEKVAIAEVAGVGDADKASYQKWIHFYISRYNLGIIQQQQRNCFEQL